MTVGASVCGPDLVEGSTVARGEVIGWVGDSGNAEATVPHLHFELHNPDGLAVDPRQSLLAAQNAAVLADPQPSWPFADDDGTSAEAIAALLLTQGVLLDCDGTRVDFCPDRIADPELAAVVARHLAGKSPPEVEGQYRPIGDASACPPQDACLLYGLPETEIARLAIWIRIDALVATLRPGGRDRGCARGLAAHGRRGRGQAPADRRPWRMQPGPRRRPRPDQGRDRAPPVFVDPGS